MMKRLFPILSLLVMTSAFAQGRSCSLSDFQSCRTCAQLNAVIDLKNPNAGDYYRGAEWNGLYAAYVLNCQVVAAKLIRAGANPSSGGTSGSMIMTVASKWPHDNKQINEAWASLLLASGASVNTSLNLRDGKSTKQVMTEESWYKPEYPDLLSLFERGAMTPKRPESNVNARPNSERLERKPAQDKDKKLTYCLLPKAQYGRYSSYDGGKSAASLLQEACPAEYLAWVDTCIANGDSKESCITKAAIIAQMAIKMFNK